MARSNMVKVTLIALLLFKGNNAELNEPSCYSRFDYDMKMFETVADMKQNQKTTLATITQLQGLVKELTAVVSEQERTRLEINRRFENIDSLITEQKTRITGLNSLRSESGSTFVRWGRKSCTGNGTSLVYTGIVGGSFYSQSGGGSDYQCLPEDPTWGVYQDGTQGSKSFMYGSEYSSNSIHFDALVDKEVPCAVCLSPRSCILMIPARTSCYPGLSLEYEGNLVTDYNTHHRTQYICVDKNPETALRIFLGNQNGALFFTVEGRCGSLPCPPYVEGRELACVVCTR